MLNDVTFLLYSIKFHFSTTATFVVASITKYFIHYFINLKYDIN